MVCVVGCDKNDDPSHGGDDENNDIEVDVTTYTPQDITQTTAKFGGEVIVIQGVLPDEFGVCWSIKQNPVPVSINGYVSTMDYDEPFYCSVTDLMPDTKYYVRAYAVVANKYYYGEEMSFTTLESHLESSGAYNGHDYIDLGLPSGTLWATCNVGAATMYNYGDYFAWGGIHPKGSYNWSTYLYCNGAEDQLTKYCFDSIFGYDGYTDNLTTLQPEDDAATANWGAGWRMPTQEEWQELFTNTVGSGMIINGVDGWLFTASNGNGLFLPFAGYRSYGTHFKAGSSSYSWTSTLHNDNPGYAWPAISHPSESYLYTMFRYYGLTVRPVCSSVEN